MTATDTDLLKLCPFCGSRPVIMSKPFVLDKRLYYVKCGQIQENGSKGCLNAWLNLKYITKINRDKAIKEWNRQCDRIVRYMNSPAKNQWVEEDNREGEE